MYWLFDNQYIIWIIWFSILVWLMIIYCDPNKLFFKSFRIPPPKKKINLEMHDWSDWKHFQAKLFCYYNAI